MDKKIIFPVVIPEKFFDNFFLFEKIIENDDEFKDALQTLDSRYRKKSKQNQLRSAKIRFLIAKYLIENKKKKLANETP